MTLSLLRIIFLKNKEKLIRKNLRREFRSKILNLYQRILNHYNLSIIYLTRQIKKVFNRNDARLIKTKLIIELTNKITLLNKLVITINSFNKIFILKIIAIKH